MGRGGGGLKNLKFQFGIQPDTRSQRCKRIELNKILGGLRCAISIKSIKSNLFATKTHNATHKKNKANVDRTQIIRRVKLVVGQTMFKLKK